MTQLDRIEKTLTAHVEKSNVQHLEMTKQITTLTTNERVNHERLNDVEAEAILTKANRAFVKGGMWVIGVLWLVLTIAVGVFIKLTT